MSFFTDVLDSIGGDKAPPPPPKRPTLSTSEPVRLTSKAGVTGGASSTPQNGLKRKAEDDGRKIGDNRTIKPNPTPGLTSTIKMNQAPPSRLAARPAGVGAGIQSKEALPPTPSSAQPAKAPAKGSFADIVARAKAAQEHRGNNQVGVIKHQTQMSKAEQRKKQEEEKAKTLRSMLGPKLGSGDRVGKRTGRVGSRSVSPAKKQNRPEREAREKEARPPTQKSTSSYRGTMGLKRKGESSKAGRSGPSRNRKSERYDEYLGTDEEDNSDIGEDDEEEEGFGSDASSDMEAGAFDIDEEENRALKAAKIDDAKEAELEQRLKKEKEERRRRLQKMADKGKR